MKEDGKCVVSTFKYWAIVSAISGNEMNKTFGANREMFCVKDFSLLIWRKNIFPVQWVVESIILKRMVKNRV
jgi:hypothetical protein